ncbi:MAG: pentapeptide repeat-containing protein [Bacilli bacterium]|nr:pentapeptide repeat-containing protein [Bacilli bacterium]
MSVRVAASLIGASLEAASLVGATLEVASLVGAALEAASLVEALPPQEAKSRMLVARTNRFFFISVFSLFVK